MRQTSFLLLVFLASNLHAADWPQWRGPNRDGHAESTVKDWPKSLTRKWQVTVGEGHSSPVVVGEHVFLFARQNDKEVLRCLKLKDGKEVWSKSYEAPYEMHPAARTHGKGPKSTPVVADGRIYTFGISGILSCRDIKDGRQIWQRSFEKTFKKTSPLYGTAMSPIVHNGMLIAHVGGNNKGALTAFDAKTGDTKWEWDEDGPGYSSPIIFKTGGAEHLVTLTQRTVIGVDPKAGNELWRLPFKTDYDQNSVTPVVYKDLLIVSGLNRGTQAYRLTKVATGWRPRQVWSQPSIAMYMSTPVVHGKYLFGLSHRRAGQLFCASAETGKVLWTSEGRFSKNAAFIDAGNAILVQNVEGQIQVLEPTFKSRKVMASYRLSAAPTWAHPALVGRRLLVKDKTTLICFGVE